MSAVLKLIGYQNSSGTPTQTSILSLSEDPIYEIFKRLSVTDLLSVGSTCKKFRKEADLKSLWEKFAKELNITSSSPNISYKKLIIDIMRQSSIENCPSYLKDDKSFALMKVRASGQNLVKFPNFANDKQVVLKAIESKDFSHCNSFSSLVGKHSFEAVNYAPEGASKELREDRDIVNAAWWVKATNEERFGCYLLNGGVAAVFVAAIIASVRNR